MIFSEALPAGELLYFVGTKYKKEEGILVEISKPSIRRTGKLGMTNWSTYSSITGGITLCSGFFNSCSLVTKN